LGPSTPPLGAWGSVTPWNRTKFLREVERSRLTKGAREAADRRPELAYRNLLDLIRAGTSSEPQLINSLWLLHHLLVRRGVTTDFEGVVDAVSSVLVNAQSFPVRDAAARVLLIHCMYGVASSGLAFSTTRARELAHVIAREQPSLVTGAKYVLELCERRES
jgi:hypothetical protein